MISLGWSPMARPSGRVGVDDLPVPVLGVDDQRRRRHGIERLTQEMTIQLFQ